MKTIILLMIAICVSSMVKADCQVLVSVRYKETGSPVSYAKVRIWPISYQGSIQGANAGEDGRLLIRHLLPYETYLIEVSMGGNPYMQEVYMTSEGYYIEVDFVLPGSEVIITPSYKNYSENMKILSLKSEAILEKKRCDVNFVS